MKHRHLVFSRSFVALAVSLSLVACGSNQSADKAATASQIALGIDMPVSGADTTDGVPARNGAILAIEEANAAHMFGSKVTLVASDLDDAVNGKHDPAQGAQNVKTFISDDRVLAMMGPFNSNVATAEIPLTNDAGLAQLSPSVTSDGMTTGTEAANLRRSHPDINNFFRVCAADSRQGQAAAQFAHALKYSRVYIIDDNETYGTGLAGIFEKQFTALGGTILGHEHITTNQQDFKALLTKVAVTKPDMIFYGGTTSTGGGLVRKQMGDAGLSDVGFMGGDGISDDEFLHVAGSLADGSTYTVVAPDIAHIPGATRFIQAYQKRFKSSVGAYSVNGYVAAQIGIAGIAAAMKDAHGEIPTRAAVLAKIAATHNFASPIGLISFDKNGDTTSPVVSLYRVTGGKPVFVRQVTAQ